MAPSASGTLRGRADPDAPAALRRRSLRAAQLAAARPLAPPRAAGAHLDAAGGQVAAEHLAPRPALALALADALAADPTRRGARDGATARVRACEVATVGTASIATVELLAGGFAPLGPAIEFALGQVATQTAVALAMGLAVAAAARRERTEQRRDRDPVYP